MTLYITDDGETYQANNATELVDAMRASSWSETDSRQAWMKETSARLKEMRDLTISCASPEKFVAGMIEAGILKEKPDAA